MVVVLCITLFTSRIVLKELGFEDYGIYNVVGGVVAMFSFLKSSMSSSTQRFLSYEMGKGNTDKLQKTFSICFSAHVIIALILLLLAETIGLWFLNTHLNIPEGRITAANWIYQFSVISLCVSIISIPYNADIISNEKMGYFAFLGILDAALKFAIAYMITISPIDRLIFYGFLIMLISVNDLCLNWIYCHRKYPETHYKFYWNTDDFKKVFSFSGWTIWGQLAIVGSNQGSNILVNMFFSVTANAAMGIGHQVNTSITGLISNFQTAFKPQITKSYAEGDYCYLNNLVEYSSKISFFLLFLASFPIILNIDYVLDLWLDKVPGHAAELCVIFIFASLCNAISAPLWMCIFATGNIKKYQIAMSVAYVVELLIIFILFRCGMTLTQGIMMKAFLNFVVIFIRLYYTHVEVKLFEVWHYLSRVVSPLLLLTLVYYSVALLLNKRMDTLGMKLLLTIALEFCALISSIFVGLSKKERNLMVNTILKKNNKH